MIFCLEDTAKKEKILYKYLKVKSCNYFRTWSSYQSSLPYMIFFLCSEYFTEVSNIFSHHPELNFTLSLKHLQKINRATSQIALMQYS